MNTTPYQFFLLGTRSMHWSSILSGALQSVVFGCLLWWAQPSWAASSVYLPVANGSVGAFQNTLSSDVEVFGGQYPWQGVLEFSAFNPAPYTSIQLQLSPSSRPLYVDTIYVYGYDNADGQLTPADFNAGTYLGTLHVPSTLLFHQYVSFDVTSFVDSVSGSFFGFNLRTDETVGPDTFTTVGNSYGNPPELVAVPEPSSFALLALSVTVVAATIKRKQCNGVP